MAEVTGTIETARAGRRDAAVAEIQGLYGPFSFPEKLFQKIWLRRDFNRAAATLADGRTLQVLHQGRWNLLGGPDFKGARLRFGNDEVTGDVELHLRAEDWDAHGHAGDPAYAGVVLHVVLFPPRPDQVTRRSDGSVIPLLVLLPLLHHDLEEYAAEAAVELLANHSAAYLCEELGVLGGAELDDTIRRHAAQRWRQKVHFARLRIRRLGWEAACHCVALEILGYRFNRAPMLRVAARHPLREWVRGAPLAEAVFAGEGAVWSLQGVRPANHPRTRLRQYALWVHQRPDWPARLEIQAGGLSVGDVAAASATAVYRRGHRLGSLRSRLADAICANAVSGTRFDNLVCDGFLPLVSAQLGRELGGLWFNWFPGDVPPHLLHTLRALGAGGRRDGPASHGGAQGLLGWLIERERLATSPQPTALGRGA
jgi:hypothetical protein